MRIARRRRGLRGSLGTAFARGGTITAASGCRAATSA
jgi:hypothetical protein